MQAEGYGLLAVLGLVCPLCGRERSLGGIGGAMVAVQIALHFAFDAAGAGRSAAAMSGMPMPEGSGVHPMSACAAATHLLAALIASWWLYRGEAAFWSLLRRRAGGLVAALAAWWTGRHVPVLRVHPPAGAPRRWPVRQPLLRHAVSRRGPPAPVTPRVLCV
jgi:hypothetical protein